MANVDRRSPLIELIFPSHHDAQLKHELVVQLMQMRTSHCDAVSIGYIPKLPSFFHIKPLKLSTYLTKNIHFFRVFIAKYFI